MNNEIQRRRRRRRKVLLCLHRMSILVLKWSNYMRAHLYTSRRRSKSAAKNQAPMNGFRTLRNYHLANVCARRGHDSRGTGGKLIYQFRTARTQATFYANANFIIVWWHFHSKSNDSRAKRVLKEKQLYFLLNSTTPTCVQKFHRISCYANSEW